jgi:fermentation-respiration switch protein FrsA (DUF1100 family)
MPGPVAAQFALRDDGGSMRALKIFAKVLAVSYLVLVAIFFVAQRNLLYFPTRTHTPLAEARANDSFREISAKTVDGVLLKAWYSPATAQRCTIVFFHGNADCLSTTAPIADPYIRAGYGFLLTEYRGYSGLPGSPTETGLYNDARALLRDLTARGVPSRQLILFGHSLGTGVAVEMASEFHVGGLLLLAPYLSIPKVAGVHFPFLPASLLALDRFNNEKKMPSIHVPLLIANGSVDEVIPQGQGLKLFSLANEPKEFHSIPLHGHNDVFDDFAPLSLDWLQRTCR